MSIVGLLSQFILTTCGVGSPPNVKLNAQCSDYYLNCVITDKEILTDDELFAKIYECKKDYLK